MSNKNCCNEAKHHERLTVGKHTTVNTQYLFLRRNLFLRLATHYGKNKTLLMYDSKYFCYICNVSANVTRCHL